MTSFTFHSLHHAVLVSQLTICVLLLSPLLHQPKAIFQNSQAEFSPAKYKVIYI
ncbi:hypothetical protein [Vibrio gallaecicus]|uniref:hypothetical protein n=1 Tax=Vibrio gallaecicus TaxID=552386 RepID=UPI0025B3858D|nr:hypothetical protein [Vibrio gallaecicus]MDN3614885.1 hypothetical protein [Vibrio gallaecicus]